MSNNINWNEKYRPDKIENIILSNYNKLIIDNIISKNYFPNLLLYGPPGTGKTTTIINLINNYLNKYYVNNKKQIIHLNASDERGIEIIRNNLYTFVISDNLFFEGPKFIILDEVDYMTKSAQIALKYLIEYYNNYNVRYCLICNYITKIDNNLQNYFCKLKFNNIPKIDILNFLHKISINEKLNVSEDYLNSIIYLFKNDIRAMINYLQLNNKNNKNLTTNDMYDELYNINIKEKYDVFLNKFLILEKKYNFSYYEFIKKYIYYILTNNINIIKNNTIKNLEFFIHNFNKINNKNLIIYNLYSLINN
jgi:DNA polymerase III delta prime subunit